MAERSGPAAAAKARFVITPAVGENSAGGRPAFGSISGHQRLSREESLATTGRAGALASIVIERSLQEGH